MKGIIDRFEGDLAVILIESENREIHVPIRELPDECKVKSAVNIDESTENVNPVITHDAKTSVKKTQRSTNLRETLLNQKKNSRLKRRK
ncbi:DUF3006 domain-containing protein [Oceanobacillus sp. J11TS1]|uniref:DUF3006 domain-containing protein n=1 Tax=Oceanobacillus sp. J11TS1 TaxID=2807191 RepID=UPI001B087D25|nr:hypothetical protein J11TS1_30940 [Oceanobacillus sp. J11TS1]